MFPKIIPICLLYISIFISCTNRHAAQPISFYYWHSDSYLKDSEKNCIKKNNTQTLYTKILDIDWSEIYGAYPKTTFEYSYLKRGLEYDSIPINLVPVIFLTNRSIEKTPDTSIHSLAEKISKKTYLICDSSFAEIQLDCDWTASTQKKYFNLLQELKQLLPNKKITSTLRLHQFHNPSKTGVPPVDEVYLMVYNTGNVKSIEEKNSILNIDEAKKYFQHTTKYPLPLHVALPLYSWGIIFKQNQFFKISNGMDMKTVSNPNYFSSNGNHIYEVKKDTVIDNVYLRIGDKIRIEKAEEEDVIEAAKIFKSAVTAKENKIILFELNETELSKYSNNIYEKISDAFSK